MRARSKKANYDDHKGDRIGASVRKLCAREFFFLRGQVDRAYQDRQAIRPARA
jgi:hypothetical protein